MGNGDRDRCKTIHGESLAPSALVARILQEVDAANEYIVDLRDAIAREDKKRITTLRAALHAVWTNARGAITHLEQLSRQREVHARALLEESEASARGTLDELWALVKRTNG